MSNFIRAASSSVDASNMNGVVANNNSKVERPTGHELLQDSPIRYLPTMPI